MKAKRFLLAFLVTTLFTFSAQAQTCYDLIAGQNEVAGNVCVSSDTTNLYVKYSTIGDWLLDEVHLFVGTSIADMPTTKKGNPKVGNFPYKQEDIGSNYAEFIIPLASLGNPECNTDLFIAAHASVQRTLDGGSIQQETAWSEGDPIVEKGNWGTFSTFTIPCEPEPPTSGSCETAFAKGDTTFIDLGLTQSRWGWEITEVAPGSYSYPIYAGAGQNDITKGTLVGHLSVEYDGSSVTVTYNMLSGFVLEETHLFVGTTHTTTIAPGQYGNLHDLSAASSDSFTLSGFSGQPLFIVAHAVSCEAL